MSQAKCNCQCYGEPDDPNYPCDHNCGPALPPVRSHLVLVTSLLEQACCLLDNVANRDTPQWQAAMMLFAVQLRGMRPPTDSQGDCP